jgi:multiple antibiotic resistance protein
MSFRASFTDLEIIFGILINAVVIFLVLKMAGGIQKLIGESGINIIERLFGIILISIGIKIFLENLVISIDLITMNV